MGIGWHKRVEKARPREAGGPGTFQLGRMSELFLVSAMCESLALGTLGERGALSLGTGRLEPCPQSGVLLKTLATLSRTTRSHISLSQEKRHDGTVGIAKGGSSGPGDSHGAGSGICPELSPSETRGGRRVVSLVQSHAKPLFVFLSLPRSRGTQTLEGVFVPESDIRDTRLS